MQTLIHTHIHLQLLNVLPVGESALCPQYSTARIFPLSLSAIDQLTDNLTN